jgi:hypothetical protein
LAFLTQNKAKSFKHLIATLVFEKNAIFSPEIVRKSQKIAIVASTPGAKPTIASYNTSVVNFYNATESLACFENKIILLNFEKRSSLGTTTLA